MRHAGRVTLFAPLLLAVPLLLLAMAVVALGEHGPLGWAAGALLVVGVLWAAWRAGVLVLRWWRSTKVAPRPQVRPADLRRLPRS